MRHRSRHIRHAIMHHAVNHVTRIRVRCGPCRLHATSLVDGHIHNDCALFHRSHHAAGHNLWRCSSGNQNTTNHQVGLFCCVSQVVAVRSQCIKPSSEDVFKLAQ